MSSINPKTEPSITDFLFVLSSLFGNGQVKVERMNAAIVAQEMDKAGHQSLAAASKLQRCPCVRDLVCHGNQNVTHSGFGRQTLHARNIPN